MKTRKNDKPRQPLIKTKVKPDNSIEVELKTPANSAFGKILIWILVAGMTLMGLVGLIFLMIEVGKKL